MKNITISIDDETYRKARIRAAELDTSVSAMVRRFLESLDTRESEFDRLEHEEKKLRELVRHFDPTDRLSRDEVHDTPGAMSSTRKI